MTYRLGGDCSILLSYGRSPRPHVLWTFQCEAAKLGAIGPLLAGLIMDNLNPDLVWYLAGLSALLAAAGYMWLQLRGAERVEPEVKPERSETAA